MIAVKGNVFSGLKEASSYILMPEYQHAFEKTLGFLPYPGTLNLNISSEDMKKISERKAEIIAGFSKDGRKYDSVKCYRAALNDSSPAAVIFPDSSKYTAEKISAIEIISPFFLRERFFLSDGDSFEIYLK